MKKFYILIQKMSDWGKSSDNNRVFKKKDYSYNIQGDTSRLKKNKSKAKRGGTKIEKIYMERLPEIINSQEYQEEDSEEIVLPKIKPQAHKPDFDKWMAQKDDDDF